MTAHEEAARARMALAKLETQAVWAREQGASLPDAFWSAFGKAHKSVQLAEREVRLEEERQRRGRGQ
jgi:hypothetical protein